jgi:hypothetical protein
VHQALEKITLNDGQGESECQLCHSIFSNPIATFIHQLREHALTMGHQVMVLCVICRLPLYGEGFDEHFAREHATRCCGIPIKTLGKQILHALLKHPRQLNALMDANTFLSFVHFTKNTQIPLPWKNSIRNFITKYNQVWDRRRNSLPLPRTDLFRNNYNPGPAQNPVEDLMIPQAAILEVTEDLSLLTIGVFFVMIEKLVIKEIAQF